MILGFAHHWPVTETMAFELEYHPNLQLSVEEKRELLGRTGMRARCVWMFDHNKELVGESYGMSCKDEPFNPDDQGYDDLRPWMTRRGPRALYCYSTTILKSYQGQGLGKILKAYFLGRVSEHYEVVVGHAREGASTKLNADFGAEFSSTYGDWYGTGQTYFFYRLNLQGARR